ncbi:MAG: DUF2282 domain-containing protein [Hyphomicrobiales bacterium]|nr:DUF2282 domain-containing protein [Rickettsiales bacterium]MCP5361052.1 DUF2282 domain-containing protein [Hyphomicrobiales bacterium]
MKNSTKMLAAAVMTMGATSVIGMAATAEEGAEKEKCYGIVKAGKNDCGAADGSHSCAGSATADSGANEWIFLPKGTCDRIVGGSTTAPGAESDESAS